MNCPVFDLFAHSICSSIRDFPVETEQIQLWKRKKEIPGEDYIIREKGQEDDCTSQATEENHFAGSLFAFSKDKERKKHNRQAAQFDSRQKKGNTEY